MSYIVIDIELIHGFGETAEAAWADAMRTFREAGIEVFAETPDEGYQGSWTLESNLKVRRATEALIRDVQDKGGNCGWYIDAHGVCCTRAEYEPATE